MEKDPSVCTKLVFVYPQKRPELRIKCRQILGVLEKCENVAIFGMLGMTGGLELLHFSQENLKLEDKAEIWQVRKLPYE